MNWNKYSLFKLPSRHRRFEYVPRYYDPKKEELQKKIRAAKRIAKQSDEGGIDESREISFRQHASDKWGNSEFKNQAMRSNVRLIVIFAIVLIAFYFLYQQLDNVAPWLDSQSGK